MHCGLRTRPQGGISVSGAELSCVPASLWRLPSPNDLIGRHQARSGPLATGSTVSDESIQASSEALDNAWADAEKLKSHRVTEKVAGQLYAAVASIGANLAEGYSRSSGRDRARIFEYALGSAREGLTWYDASRPVLGEEVVRDRVQLLEEVRRLLLAVIPRERDRLIRPATPRC